MMSWPELWELYQMGGPIPAESLRPRYNMAPTQRAVAIRLEAGERTAVRLRWGLLPAWAKDKKLAYKTINARGETVATKPSFRAAFKARRCLVPVSGFYEWSRESQPKIPHHIHRTDGLPLTLAGLWERWAPEEGDPIESFTIVTTAANGFVDDFHDRMPVALEQDSWSGWLDPKTPTDMLHAMIAPREWPGMAADPVSMTVNNTRNDSPECLDPP